MNEILKKRIEEGADHFAHLYPKVSVADVITFRKDAFAAGARFALSNQWISVDEALPDYEEGVLVIDKLGVENTGYYFNHRSNNPMVKTYKNGFCDIVFEEVAYWMPVPELNTGKTVKLSNSTTPIKEL